MTKFRAGRSSSWRLVGGVVAPGLFITTFSVLGVRRRGYDWRRDAVSSLAVPPGGAPQRINFIVTGVLIAAATDGLRRRSAVPRAASWLIEGAGIGLVGSGTWVTDEVAGHRTDTRTPGPPEPARAGHLHNLCALPIFVGLPFAALLSAIAAARDREWPWSAVSAATAVLMPACFLCFGASYGPVPALADKGGVFQRLSILTGFSWVGASCMRALRTRERGTRAQESGASR
jgi:hypothetical protein